MDLIPGQDHPLFWEWAKSAEKVADCYAGERAVKERGEVYLPPTSAMVLDGMANPRQMGAISYQAYLTRARFEPFVSEAVEDMVGAMHHKPATINLPSSMEYLRDSATVHGDSLDALLRRIHEMQLVPGRGVLVLDIAQTGAPTARPKLALYDGRILRNWDWRINAQTNEQEPTFLVLREYSHRRAAGSDSWQTVEIERRLELYVEDRPFDPMQDGATNATRYVQTIRTNGATAEESDSVSIEPTAANRRLDFIPAQVFNACDLEFDPDAAPMEPLADLALSAYRSSADYERALHHQTEDTLVIIGDRILQAAEREGDPVRTGSTSVIHVAHGGDAKWIGSDSSGIPSMADALKAKIERAQQLGSRLLETGARADESGVARGMRIAANTASLTDVAKTGAMVLERVLRMCAAWIGANPAEVEVEANTDFSTDRITAQDFATLVVSGSAGLPLSRRSRHEWLVRNELTTMTYEEELAAMAEDDAADFGAVDPDLRLA